MIYSTVRRNLLAVPAHGPPTVASPLPNSQLQAKRRLGPLQRRTRCIAAAFLALLLLGAAAYVLRRPLLTGMANAIIVDEPLAPAGFIFVLGGDTHLRLAHAAKLFHQGIAPRVVIMAAPLHSASVPGTNSDPAYPFVQVARERGIPDSAITVLRFPAGYANTEAEGQLLGGYLEQNPARRVVVVTSAYHTGRARWTLRRELRGVPVEIRMSASPDPGFDASNWWHTEEGFAAYVTEVLKFVHTLLRA